MRGESRSRPETPSRTMACWCIFEIDRARTPDALFSQGMMGAVFLSEKYLTSDDNEVAVPPSHLETLEVGQHWVAYFRSRRLGAFNLFEGVIYVYMGRVGDGRRGDPMYGIKYKLHFPEGKLTDNSEVWMSALGGPSVQNPPRPGFIPFSEWFDDKPIPAITDENTTDPKLLGVEEYVKKGLVPPEATPGAGQGDPRHGNSRHPADARAGERAGIGRAARRIAGLTAFGTRRGRWGDWVTGRVSEFA